MSNDKSSAEKVIEQLNSTNAKRIALLMVIGFACYHELLHLRYGSNSCRWLLSNGRYKGNQEWQPYGCMLHHYTKIDTRKCLRYLAFYGKETRFVFIGDSRIRDLYVGFVKHLQQQEGDVTAPPTNLETDLLHVDNKLKIRVEYIWTPYISKKMIEHFRSWKDLETPPSVIIVGCGFWSIKTSNASQTVLQEYSVNLTRLVQPIDTLHRRNSRVLWALQGPVDLEKMSTVLQFVNNEQIDLYNKAAIQVLSYSSAEVWWSARLVAEGMVAESPDGVHLASRALKQSTQILLNMYCNDYMNFNDGTCCSTAEPHTTLQVVTFSIFGMCVIIFIVMFLHRKLLDFRGQPVQEYTLLTDGEPTSYLSTASSAYTLFKSLATLSLIMCYFFICDRTNFFMKENKYYSEFSFWLPIGYISVLGLFFTEDSSSTKILHGNQINEWKGWMQLVILVYQVTGASQVLPINMHIKVLISSYLFLLGYQQFVYVFQRGDTSLIGLFKMLFQLNFMTVTLCLCMNRPYQFYYFVPLLSFWYLTCYTTLALPPLITLQSSENNIAQYLYLVIKFIGMFSVITVLFMSEVFFEKVFVTRPWKAFFVTTDDDIHEWWSRWKLDRYSSLYGMLFGSLLLTAQRYNLFDDNNHSNLFSRGIALSATLASIIGLCCYVTFTFLCRSELDCSEIHSYIVCIPILSYIILRNISGMLRTRYSSLFAWFGNISLELFISQYHTWLAVDTHGVLVLIPGYPMLNVMITSFIFVCASHEVNRLTKVLLPYAIPNDFKFRIINLVVFLIVLVIIGINDGMF